MTPAERAVVEHADSWQIANARAQMIETEIKHGAIVANVDRHLELEIEAQGRLIDAVMAYRLDGIRSRVNPGPEFWFTLGAAFFLLAAIIELVTAIVT